VVAVSTQGVLLPSIRVVYISKITCLATMVKPSQCYIFVTGSRDLLVYQNIFFVSL